MCARWGEIYASRVIIGFESRLWRVCASRATPSRREREQWRKKRSHSTHEERIGHFLLDQFLTGASVKSWIYFGVSSGLPISSHFFLALLARCCSARPPLLYSPRSTRRQNTFLLLHLVCFNKSTFFFVKTVSCEKSLIIIIINFNSKIVK